MPEHENTGPGQPSAEPTAHESSIDPVPAATAPADNGADTAALEPASQAPPAAAPAMPSIPVTPFSPPTLEAAGAAQTEASLDFLDDVELDVRVELGRAEMLIEDVLKLSAGAVVELDKVAGDPVDIYVNARLVARGEVLVLNDTFCVRVNEIVSSIPESEPAR